MNSWTVHNLLPDRLPAPIEPDRGGYTVTMRESAGAEEVLAELAAGSAGDGRVHLGWGSFRNLDIAAVRRSSWVLLLDINLHQFRVWQGVRAAMADPACRDADAFVDIVVPLLPHQPRLRQFSASTDEWLRADLDRPGSWLHRGRPERFAWVRDLFREDRIATGCADLRASRDSGIFPGLAERIALAAGDATLRFDTLYVSNLPWMLAQREGFFGESNARFASQENALERMRDNLEDIAPRFAHVIEAGHVAETSRPDDLQWQTRLIAPEAFLESRYWSVLEPVSGPFRSLR